jgi:hypothetical protein
MKLQWAAIRISIVILSFGICSPEAAFAQVDPWERVKLIEPGKSVHVKLNAGRTVKGRMESWTAEGLTVRQGKDKVVNLTKSEVARVAMVTGMSRGRKAAYGGAIGGAIGAGVTAGICAASICDYPGAVTAGGALWVGGLAAGIAALFPQHKEVIYTASPAGTNSNPAAGARVR